MICAASIRPEAIRWLWRGWLARGKLAILAGVAGTGKSTVVFCLAAAVTTGAPWPDGSRCETAGNVLLWSAEDDAADTIVPRLMAAGANLNRVHVIKGKTLANGQAMPFDPAHDVPELAPHQPYLLSPRNDFSSHVYSQVRAMPPRQHEVIAHTVDQHGEDTWAIVEFYNERILPLQNRAIAHIKENPTDAGGALVELPGHRASNFEGTLMAYQSALLDVRQAKIDRRPPREQAAIAERAKQAFKTLNERFRVELRRFQGTTRSRRGTALANPERAINQARSSRTAKPITFSNTRQVVYLNRFAQGARIAGRGLLVLDAGIRANKVHNVYQQAVTGHVLQRSKQRGWR